MEVKRRLREIAVLVGLDPEAVETRVHEEQGAIGVEVYLPLPVREAEPE